jgi:hypothetical protein
LQVSGIPYLEFNPRAGGIDFYGDTLFTTEAMIRDHPAQVKAFLDASLLGWHYALTHPDEIIDLILRDYGARHSREHLQFEAQQSRQLIMPEVVEIGYMNPGRWQAIADIYQKLGLLGQNHSLVGFLYERNPTKPSLWLYSILVGIGLVVYYWPYPLPPCVFIVYRKPSSKKFKNVNRSNQNYGKLNNNFAF